MTKIFFDYNSTTPVLPEVQALMQEVMALPANPSSVHSFGRRARTYIERAREEIGALAGVQPGQVVFTGSATESNNTVLQAFKGERILISAIEHPSVSEAAPEAERIPVTVDGVVDEEAFAAMLTDGPPPALVAVMLVNNETGVIQPVEKLARLVKKLAPSAYFFTDAVQAAGKLPIDFPALQVDYMSLSAHKMGGPQGAGALIIAPGARPVKLLHGGGQEKRQRAGTENVPAIAGFGLAASVALKNLQSYQQVGKLRDRLESAMQARAPNLRIFGKNVSRTANTIAVTVPGVEAQTVIMALDMEGIAISSGSACSSGTTKSSRVAQAMKLSEDEVKGAYRISLGKETSEADIDRFIEVWSAIMKRMDSKERAHA